mmetsp:Transcript_27873/g.34410  ORF Transcript_27873/g.34410 Transcript_27873/m.34410 type:complete len:407 (-) Transcript_27873:103-1323(-)
MFNDQKLHLDNTIIHECGNYHRQNTSRSVSWNCTGTMLASASSSAAKLWPCPESQSNPVLRELNQLKPISSSSASNNSSNNIGVDRVRFHPFEPSILCTNVEDKSVQIWDVRVNHKNHPKPFANIKLNSNSAKCAASTEWFGSSGSGSNEGNRGHTDKGHYLVITEKDNSVYVYDIRKLQQQKKSQSGGIGRGKNHQVKPIRSFKMDPHIVFETHFTPSGSHLISAVKNGNNGMGCLIVYPWEENNSQDHNNNNKNVTNWESTHTFMGHTAGPIYSLRFAPNGQQMSTGGNDALVGLWDVKHMVCTSTISHKNKFIRSVSYSFDSKIVACCTEEEGIDLASSASGDLIGTVHLASSGRSGNSQKFGTGADEVAFHPKSYILACARGDFIGSQVPQVTIAKLQISSQ